MRGGAAARARRQQRAARPGLICHIPAYPAAPRAPWSGHSARQGLHALVSPSDASPGDLARRHAADRRTPYNSSAASPRVGRSDITHGQRHAAPPHGSRPARGRQGLGLGHQLERLAVGGLLGAAPRAPGAARPRERHDLNAPALLVKRAPDRTDHAKLVFNSSEFAPFGMALLNLTCKAGSQLQLIKHLEGSSPRSDGEGVEAFEAEGGLTVGPFTGSEHVLKGCRPKRHGKAQGRRACACCP